MQGLVLALVIAVLALAVTDTVDDWSDWLVLGVLVLTTFGAALAVHHRQYPTKKRTFTRDSDSDW